MYVYEQRHFYANKAKKERAIFVWKTTKQDTRLENEIG